MPVSAPVRPFASNLEMSYLSDAQVTDAVIDNRIAHEKHTADHHPIFTLGVGILVMESFRTSAHGDAFANKTASADNDRDGVLDTARSFLKQTIFAKEPLELDAMDNDGLLQYLFDHQSKHQEASEKALEVFEEHKNLFIENAIQASANGWLPLTEEQIIERLAPVKIKFMDFPQELTEASRSRFALEYGHYTAYNKTSHIPLRMHGNKNEKYSAYYTLAQALGGARHAKDGLEREGIGGFTSRSRSLIGAQRPGSMDHAVAHVIATSFIRQEFVQAGGQVDNPLFTKVRQVLLNAWLSHRPEVQAFGYAFTDIPMENVLNAYCKSDFDSHEEDPLARTHALKDLHHSGRIFAGINWTTNVRNVDQTLSKMPLTNRGTLSPEAIKSLVKLESTRTKSTLRQIARMAFIRFSSSSRKASILDAKRVQRQLRKSTR